MTSSSPDRGLSRTQRVVLGIVLATLALGLPAAGLARAGFGADAQVTITISIAPTSPAPTPSTTP
ncbi:hypothetical protein [Cellulomonas denverensis]|uniref:Uncharacterized protein n=1 Tax=Cellulomonas denverensis TaxID=264297 RepID=A0A7X6QXV2_9CELL|nr:hypothetical protein [Cellulomonas denverensis]NKY21460.1 hypothetical protein [Cellulomonas denverensis]GIG26668.1 hypothetical protein Cde04nite_29120 [Cellulomonas denverensis]